MLTAAVNPEKINRVGLLSRNLYQSTGTPVLVALLVRISAGLGDLDPWCLSEKFQS